MATNYLKTIKSTVKNWYMPLIIGILLIVLGIYTLSSPVASYLALSFMFTWYFLISGIMEIVFALNNKKDLDGWGWHLTGGILYTLLGFILFANPAISITTLPFVVGFYSLFKSFQFMAFSIELKDYKVKNWGWVLAFAILGIVFSFILIWNPLFAGLSLVIWTGMAIISIGVASCVFAFQLKKIKSFSSKISKEWKQKFEDLKQEYYKSIDN